MTHPRQGSVSTDPVERAPVSAGGDADDLADFLLGQEGFPPSGFDQSIKLLHKELIPGVTNEGAELVVANSGRNVR